MFCPGLLSPYKGWVKWLQHTVAKPSPKYSPSGPFRKKKSADIWSKSQGTKKCSTNSIFLTTSFQDLSDLFPLGLIALLYWNRTVILKSLCHSQIPLTALSSCFPFSGSLGFWFLGLVPCFGGAHPPAAFYERTLGRWYFEIHML